MVALHWSELFSGTTTWSHPQKRSQCERNRRRAVLGNLAMNMVAEENGVMLGESDDHSGAREREESGIVQALAANVTWHLVGRILWFGLDHR